MDIVQGTWATVSHRKLIVQVGHFSQTLTPTEILVSFPHCFFSIFICGGRKKGPVDLSVGRFVQQTFRFCESLIDVDN